MMPDFSRPVLAAYNDWVAEFCNHSPKRLFGIALISLEDIQAGVKEPGRPLTGRHRPGGVAGTRIYTPETAPESADFVEPEDYVEIFSELWQLP